MGSGIQGHRRPHPRTRRSPHRYVSRAKETTRTRVTDEEVDAMRTARMDGVSVTTLVRQFGVHRDTVWAKTRLT